LAWKREAESELVGVEAEDRVEEDKDDEEEVEENSEPSLGVSLLTDGSSIELDRDRRRGVTH
jgi:hypothetical protein